MTTVQNIFSAATVPANLLVPALLRNKHIEARSQAGAATIVAQSEVSWSAVSAVVTELRCDREWEADFVADQDQMVVMLAEVGGRIDMRSAGAAATAPGTGRVLSLIPAGQRVRGGSPTIRFARYLVLRFDWAKLAALQGERVGAPRPLPLRLMFANPRLLRIAELFAGACGDTASHSVLYGDSLSLALLACLQELDAAAEPENDRGGLAPWQLRAAIRFMQENLDRDFPLQTIADVARLSCSHFSRGFRKSTGLAPHQWLIRARVARVQELLMESSHSLADIALEVGFSDQAHLTRSFGKVVGTSPGVWRRSHRDGGSTTATPRTDGMTVRRSAELAIRSAA